MGGVIKHFKVSADRQTGLWIGQPVLTGETVLADEIPRPISQRGHFDDFEGSGEEHHIQVVWAD